MRMLLLLGVAAWLSGCLTCEPQLDIKHCIGQDAACPPPGADVATWTGGHGFRWPTVEEVMRATPEGEHRHATWHGDRDELLNDLGWNGGDPEVFVQFGTDVYRLRVLIC